MANNIDVDIIRIDTSRAEQSIGNLKQQLKEAKKEMAEMRMRGEEASEAYQKLAQRAGDLTHAMRRANEDVQQASTTFTNTASYVTGALSGVAGAVQAATGALSLLGVQMGDDTKLMKTLVAAMSVTSGLTAIQNSIDAFKKLTDNIKASTLAQKGLNAAIKANPVGAVLTLVTAVAALGVAIHQARVEQSKLQLESSNTLMLNNYSELESKLNNIVAIMEIDGANDLEIYKQKSENAKKLMKLAEQNYNKYFNIVMTGSRVEREAAQDDMEFWSSEYDKRIYEYQALLDQRSVIEYRYQKQEEKKRQDEAQRAAQRRKEEKELAKRQKEELDKEHAEVLLSLKTAYEQEIALLQKTYDKQKAILEAYGDDTTELTIQFEAKKRAIRQKYDEQERNDLLAEARDNYNDDRLAAETEYWKKRLEIVRDGTLKDEEYEKKLNELDLAQFEVDRKLLEQQLSNNLITYAEYENRLTQIENDEAEKRREIAEKEKEKKLRIQQEYLNGITDISNSIAGIIGSMADIVGEDTDAYKNIKAAQAIIATLSGAVAAFMGITESTGGWGIAAAAAQAAAVMAAGFAEVKKIYAVDTTGKKNSTSGKMSAGAVTTLTENYSNTRIMSDGGGIYDLSRLEKASNTKVYVTTHDIQKQLGKVTVTTKRNTY